MLTPEQVDNYTTLTQVRSELKAAAAHLEAAKQKLAHASCWYSIDEAWLTQATFNLEIFADATRTDASKVLVSK